MVATILLLGTSARHAGAAPQFTSAFLSSKAVFYPTSAAIADLNGDGRADVVLTATQVSKVVIKFGSGDGTFFRTDTLPAMFNPYDVTVVDLNKDGKPDILTASDYSTLSVLIGNGDGTFALHVDYGTVSGTYAQGLAVADRHVAVAAAAGPAEAAPTLGSYRGTNVASTMDTMITVKVPTYAENAYERSGSFPAVRLMGVPPHAG